MFITEIGNAENVIASKIHNFMEKKFSCSLLLENKSLFVRGSCLLSYSKEARWDINPNECKNVKNLAKYEFGAQCALVMCFFQTFIQQEDNVSPNCDCR